MLSKAIRPNMNLLRRAYGNDPGILRRSFNMVDKSTTAYAVSVSDPKEPLPNLQLTESSDVPHEYNVTNLTNGFTVLTESQSFPGTVQMGKFSFISEFNFQLMITRANFRLSIM